MIVDTRLVNGPRTGAAFLASALPKVPFVAIASGYVTASDGTRWEWHRDDGSAEYGSVRVGPDNITRVTSVGFKPGPVTITKATS
jgi:hypothetical protein